MSGWKFEYEEVKEDRKRRKIIPTRDYRLDNNWFNRWERFTYISVRKARQGTNIFIKHVRSRQMVYGVALFLISIWISGFYAHAGMKFESLLAIVIGFIILSIAVSAAGKRK